jgi:hypothetical protein
VITEDDYKSIASLVEEELDIPEIDDYSIIKDENGKLTTAIGGGYVDGLVNTDIIVTANSASPSALTYEIAKELFTFQEVWSKVSTSSSGPFDC